METAAKIALLPYFVVVCLFLYRAMMGRSLIRGREDPVPYSPMILVRILGVSIMGVVGGAMLIGASMGFRTSNEVVHVEVSM